MWWSRSASTPKLSRTGIAALSAGLVLAMAACGSGETSGAESRGSENWTTPAAVADGYKPYLQEPTGLGIDKPLRARPPQGKRIAGIFCTTPGCQTMLKETEAAAAVLGWTVEPFTTTGEPEDLQKAWTRALDAKVDGIVSTGFGRDAAGPSLDEAAARNVPVVLAGVADEVAPPVINTVSSAPTFNRINSILANWVVDDSKGSAKVLFVNVPQFKMLAAAGKTFADTLAANCPGCTIQNVDAQISDIGTTIPGTVVSALQRDPDINYVAIEDGNFDSGILPALTEAGLDSQVKVVGAAAGPDSIANIRSGGQKAWVGHGYNYNTWTMIDALARHYTGDPQVVAPAEPLKLLVADNVADDGDFWQYDGLVADYRKLWRIDAQ